MVKEVPKPLEIKKEEAKPMSIAEPKPIIKTEEAKPLKVEKEALKPI
jgi:hypothetical protein